MANKWKLGQFKFIRIATDMVCVGVGTIITAFFMGPLIEFFNVHIARPMLKK